MNEHDIRAKGMDRHTVYVQKRPTDFFLALRNNAFQHALIKFLVALWEDDTNANIIQVFQFYITCGSQCFFLTLKLKKREKQKKLL